ncbi:MAG TPA: response regulator [Spirochaetota bacterium]|nr:response regulator [Spirochaetota bacterium]
MVKTVYVLLVEDEVITAMLMEAQLKKIGYRISGHVTTGENAIAVAKEKRPDIILMDIRLAGRIDGIDAASVIRSETGIPIIFITSYDDQTTRERARILNPLGFLEKPLEIFKLKSIIDSHFA